MVESELALIPPPPVVRDRLAMLIRQERLLRSLLRLSVRAAEERHRQRAGDNPGTLAPAPAPANIGVATKAETRGARPGSCVARSDGTPAPSPLGTANPEQEGRGPWKQS